MGPGLSEIFMVVYWRVNNMIAYMKISYLEEKNLKVMKTMPKNRKSSID